MGDNYTEEAVAAGRVAAYEALKEMVTDRVKGLCIRIEVLHREASRLNQEILDIESGKIVIGPEQGARY